MSTAKFNDVDVPYVSSQVVNHEFIGDRTRLAGGTMHQDKVAVKRTWQIETEHIKKSTSDNIIAELENSNWRVNFYLDDTGTVTSYVTLTDEERVQFRDNGEWQDDGRKLTFEVIEQ